MNRKQIILGRWFYFRKLNTLFFLTREALESNKKCNPYHMLAFKYLLYN